MVHFSPESRICCSASSRIRFDCAGSVVFTAVVETKTARPMAAALVAATIAGACPKPSDARLTRASQCAAPNAASSRAGSPRSPVSGRAPYRATAPAAASLRASATVSCPRRAASFSTYPPRKPLPPVTSSLIGGRPAQ